ncbi:MAG: OmpA family protein [Cyclobacteriaceae bacterium]
MSQFGNSVLRKLFGMWVLGLLVSAQCISQEKEYKYEFSSLKLMEMPNVNSYAEEIYPLYDRSYDTMYLVRSHHNANVGRDKINQDIWYTYKKDGIWSELKNLKALNNAENNSIVGISGKRERLFLLNSYTSTTVRNKGIVRSDYANGEWSKPLTLNLEVNTGGNLYAFFINHTEDIVLISMFNGLSEGEEDLFVSLKDAEGRWREPIYMGHTINSAGYETSPFLMDDNKTLFFTSDGFGGYGDGDVYMSKRLDDSWSNWTEPVNLGKQVNSDKFDGYFSIYENGEFLLASNRHSKFSDIFVGKWEKTEVVAPKKDVPVEVKVVEKSKPLPSAVSVYFDSNSSFFDKDKYNRQLTSVANYLKNNPKVGVVIEGSTDDIGGETYNLLLSLRRARGVSDYIGSLADGIKEDQLWVIPSGEAKSSADKESSRKVTIRYIVVER